MPVHSVCEWIPAYRVGVMTVATDSEVRKWAASPFCIQLAHKQFYFRGMCIQVIHIYEHMLVSFCSSTLTLCHLSFQSRMVVLAQKVMASSHSGQFCSSFYSCWVSYAFPCTVYTNCLPSLHLILLTAQISLRGGLV